MDGPNNPPSTPRKSRRNAVHPPTASGGNDVIFDFELDPASILQHSNDGQGLECQTEEVCVNEHEHVELGLSSTDESITTASSTGGSEAASSTEGGSEETTSSSSNNNTSTTTCPICLDPISGPPGQWGAVWPCGHVYHRECWKQMLKMTGSDSGPPHCSLCNGVASGFGPIFLDMCGGGARDDDDGTAVTETFTPEFYDIKDTLKSDTQLQRPIDSTTGSASGIESSNSRVALRPNSSHLLSIVDNIDQCLQKKTKTMMKYMFFIMISYAAASWLSVHQILYIKDLLFILRWTLVSSWVVYLTLCYLSEMIGILGVLFRENEFMRPVIIIPTCVIVPLAVMVFRDMVIMLSAYDKDESDFFGRITGAYLGLRDGVSTGSCLNLW